MDKHPEISTHEFERLAATGGREEYVLRLYVSGMTPRSTQAISRVKALCEERLKGRYDLNVIDIYQQPLLAVREKVVATPTLVKRTPLPLRRLVGDLANEDRVLKGLDLQPV